LGDNGLSADLASQLSHQGCGHIVTRRKRQLTFR
jgi:hypothetical protein